MSEQLKSFVAHLLSSKDHTTWHRFSERVRARLVFNSRLELESDIPGYDAGPPVAIDPRDLRLLADFFQTLAECVSPPDVETAPKTLPPLLSEEALKRAATNPLKGGPGRSDGSLVK